MNEESNKTGLLTPPVLSLFGIGSGKVFGFGIINIVEGLICVAVAIAIIWLAPLTTIAKIVIAIFYAFPLFVFNLVGIHQEDLLSYWIGYRKRKKEGSVYYFAPPIQKEKRTAKKVDMQNEKESESNYKETLLWRIADRLQN